MSPIKHWSHFWVCLHIVSLSHTHHSHVLLYIYKTEVKPANTSWVGCFNAVFLLHTRANLDQFLKKYVTRSSTNRRAHVSLLLVMLLAERARSSSKPEPLIASVTPRPAQGQSHYLRGKQIDWYHFLENFGSWFRIARVRTQQSSMNPSKLVLSTS